MDNGIDYTKVTTDVDSFANNSFEKGRRHPKWRGGVDSATRRNRQTAYRKFGLGVTTSRNSDAAYHSSELRANPISDFRSRRRTKLKVKNIPSREAVNQLLRKIFDSSVASDLQNITPDGKSTQITVDREIFEISVDFLGDSTSKSYTLAAARVGIKKASKKVTLGDIVRHERKVKAKKALRQRNIIKERKHKNTIRGFEALDQYKQRRKT